MMLKTLVALMVLVALGMQCGVYGQDGGLIIPGVSVGHAKLGMLDDDVLYGFGEPTEMKQNLWIFASKEPREFIALEFQDKRVRRIHFSSSDFQTSSGISTASLMVAATLPEELQPVQNAENKSWLHKDGGLAFTVLKREDGSEGIVGTVFEVPEKWRTSKALLTEGLEGTDNAIVSSGRDAGRNQAEDVAKLWCGAYFAEEIGPSDGYRADSWEYVLKIGRLHTELVAELSVGSLQAFCHVRTEDNRADIIFSRYLAQNYAHEFSPGVVLFSLEKEPLRTYWNSLKPNVDPGLQFTEATHLDANLRSLTDTPLTEEAGSPAAQVAAEDPGCPVTADDYEEPSTETSSVIATSEEASPLLDVPMHGEILEEEDISQQASTTPSSTQFHMNQRAWLGLLTLLSLILLTGAMLGAAVIDRFPTPSGNLILRAINTYTQNAPGLIGCMLLLLLLGWVFNMTLVLSALVMCLYFGYFKVSLSAIRDGKVRVSELFSGFNRNKLVVVIAVGFWVGLAVAVGTVALVIPGIIAATVLATALLFVADGAQGAWNSLELSTQLFRRNMLGWTSLALLVALLFVVSGMPLGALVALEVESPTGYILALVLFLVVSPMLFLLIAGAYDVDANKLALASGTPSPVTPVNQVEWTTQESPSPAAVPSPSPQHTSAAVSPQLTTISEAPLRDAETIGELVHLAGDVMKEAGAGEFEKEGFKVVGRSLVTKDGMYLIEHIQGVQVGTGIPRVVLANILGLMGPILWILEMWLVGGIFIVMALVSAFFCFQLQIVCGGRKVVLLRNVNKWKAEAGKEIVLKAMQRPRSEEKGEVTYA